jgi:hypothetical protein
VDELVDSSQLRGDPDGLRARVRHDGYALLRGVLGRDEVETARREVAKALHRARWVDSEEELHPRPPARPTDQRRAWRDRGYRRAAMSSGFHRLPYTNAFEELMRSLVGETVFSYPVKLLRVVYPQAMVPFHGGRFVHQDYSVIGVQDMFTAWVPLMDIPRTLGGLALAPGSQRTGPKPGGVLDPQSVGWATTDYRVGDVLIFHCLTSHASLPNRTDRMRLSGEFRWQSSDDPVPPGLVFGPDLDRGIELWSRLFARATWWHPVPGTIRYRPPGGPGQPGPSRYVEVAATQWPVPGANSDAH